MAEGQEQNVSGSAHPGDSGRSSNWMQVSGAGTLETIAIWGLPLVFLAAIALTVFAWHTD